MSRFLILSCLAIVILYPACEVKTVSRNNDVQAVSQTTTPLNSIDHWWSDFIEAVKSADESKARSLCDAAFWSSEEDSGERFFEQAVRKEFVFDRKDSPIKENRAVIKSDILRDDRVVDTVFLYLTLGDDWRLGGWDESEDHMRYFLDGHLPAQFMLKSYPSSKELVDVGQQLTDRHQELFDAANKTQQASILKIMGLELGNNASLSMFVSLPSASLQMDRTYFVDSIKRGAIAFSSGRDSAFMYLERADDQWRLIECSGGWLSSESILQ